MSFRKIKLNNITYLLDNSNNQVGYRMYGEVSIDGVFVAKTSIILKKYYNETLEDNMEQAYIELQSKLYKILVKKVKKVKNV